MQCSNLAMIRTEARADIIFYIECFHNPRKRRQPATFSRDESTITQQSVKSGQNPVFTFAPRLHVFDSVKKGRVDRLPGMKQNPAEMRCYG